MPHCRGEDLKVLFGIYSKIIQKKLIFLGILENIRQNHSGAPKGLPFFLAVLRHLWEGVYQRLGQSSKVALGRSMRKGQNQSTISFGLEARGEGFGFSAKLTLVFFSWDIPWADGSAPKQCLTTAGRL